MAKVYFPTREQVLAITNPLDRRVRRLEGFVRTFAQLKQIIDDKVAETGKTDDEKIAELKDELIGVEIPDRWTNTSGTVYDNPMIVINIAKYKGEDNLEHIGALLMRKYACSESIAFDAPETDEATETTVQDGVYYYGSSASSPAAATIVILNPDEYDPNRPSQYTGGMQCRYEGKVWRANKNTSGAWNASAWNDTGILALNVGDPLPSGYTKIYRNSIYDPTRNIIQYGYNNWRVSTYRQYLSSFADKSTVPDEQWWQQDYEWRNRVGNKPPSNVGTVRGYKQGCSGWNGWETGTPKVPKDFIEGLLKYVKPVYITTMKNTITDGATSGYLDTDHYETLDTFFLPSGADMYEDVNLPSGGVGVESELSPYFKAATGLASPANDQNAGRISYNETNKSSAVFVRLRSAYRGLSYVVWYVNPTGYVYNGGAGGAYAGRVACVIY